MFSVANESVSVARCSELTVLNISKEHRPIGSLVGIRQRPSPCGMVRYISGFGRGPQLLDDRPRPSIGSLRSRAASSWRSMNSAYSSWSPRSRYSAVHLAAPERSRCKEVQSGNFEHVSPAPSGPVETVSFGRRICGLSARLDNRQLIMSPGAHYWQVWCTSSELANSARIVSAQ
jgi:hypothetical protein